MAAIPRPGRQATPLRDVVSRRSRQRFQPGSALGLVRRVGEGTSHHQTEQGNTGKPIARPPDNAGWRPVGDQFMVMFPPNGLAPTETPSTATRSWPLPATLASALSVDGTLDLGGA
jgi:hypothetical protein